MGATQFNHGRQTEDLIKEGLFLDLTELSEKEGWRDFVFPSSLLDACTYDGKLYCVPVNIHSGSGSGCPTRHSPRPAFLCRPTGTSSLHPHRSFVQLASHRWPLVRRHGSRLA